jgi:hypothetical protein
MSDPRTLRILEFDGGGERGYMSLQFFTLFVQLWGITPADLAKKFDVICGTSIGGIIGLALAFGKTPAELAPFFTVQGPYIFSLTSLLPSVRPNAAAKAALIALNIPFYQSSGPTVDLYGDGLLRKTLQDFFKIDNVPATMQQLQTNVIIPSYEQDTKTYVSFSNVNYPDYIGQNELISDVAIATSAAPAYLTPLSLNDHIYLDGGIYQNNPAIFGRNLAQILKPTSKRCCVLSIGTGLGEIGFDEGNPSMAAIANTSVYPLIESFLGVTRVDEPSTVETLFSLFEIASTGGQEAVAKSLYLESTYTLNQLYYYRFQPTLDPNLNTELDNTDPAILTYYDQVAADWFADDIDNIVTFLGHLVA